MPARHTSRPVDELDLHLKVGAYDEYHHAHGYAHPREKHHWYWFAGIAAAISLTAVIGGVYTLYDRAMTPMCSRSDSETRMSPDGAYVLESVLVTCAGAAPNRRVLVYAPGGAGNVPALASFDEAAFVRIRWDGDDRVVLTKSGGRVWSFRPHYRDIRVHYVTE
ncbi:hypothetical protein ABI_45260 [Asticcacaulis biprosthecium C19]|uniref:Transmembrane protein n=1 Tax=Asticcacaulis biprosthecium C19 TaxID=715226 RepID=F4QTM9_9CAUL|nr:hypothetical protein [Asticcacaulis biprosthecium]EGF89179.1 hypothetical protein ABI_45260 [Asticcacaulis biprosthecium C19]